MMSQHVAACALCLSLWVSASALHAHEAEPHLPFERIHAHEKAEIHSHFQWDRRYLSEGRDSLDGDSLISSHVEVGWNHLAAGVLYAKSPQQHYDELHLTFAVTQTIGDVECYLGYTHLRFPSDASHDHEWGAGVTWSGLPMEVELTADVYYSFDADGSFAEIAAQREFRITDRWILQLSVSGGVNEGYVADGHRGMNHVALPMGWTYQISDAISLTAHATPSWALGKEVESPGDRTLSDFFNWGIGCECSF